MSDLNTAAPVGASAQIDSPFSDNSGPLSKESALSALAAWDKEHEAAAEAEQSATAEENSDLPSDKAPADEAAAESDETAPEEGAETPANDAETDADPEEDQYAHGNMLTRLRNGEVRRVGELKKLAEKGLEYEAKLPELTAAQQRIQEREAQIAQKELFVNQGQEVLRLAMDFARIDAKLPPPPDPALIDSDIIEYDIQRARHDLAVAEANAKKTEIQQQYAEQQQQLAQARAAEHQKLIADGHRYLREHIPEMADPKKGTAIYEDIVATCAEFGIPKQLVDATPNPNLFHMIYKLSRDSAELKALKSQKAAVVRKVQNAPPVQQPGRRVSAGDAEQRAIDEQRRKWESGGYSREDALAMLKTVRSGT